MEKQMETYVEIDFCGLRSLQFRFQGLEWVSKGEMGVVYMVLVSRASKP